MMILGALLLRLLQVIVMGPETYEVDPAAILDGSLQTFLAIELDSDSPWPGVEVYLQPREPAPGHLVLIELTDNSITPSRADVNVNYELFQEYEFEPGTRSLALRVPGEEEIRSLLVRLEFEESGAVELATIELHGVPGPYGLIDEGVVGLPEVFYPALVPGLFGPIPTWSEALRLVEAYGGQVLPSLEDSPPTLGAVAAHRLAIFDYLYFWSCTTLEQGGFVTLYHSTFEAEPFAGILAWYDAAGDTIHSVKRVWGADLDPAGGRALVGIEHLVNDWSLSYGYDYDEPFDYTAELEERLGPRANWEPYVFSDGFIGNDRITELHFVDLEDGSLTPLGLAGPTAVHWPEPDTVYLGFNTDGYPSLETSLEWHVWNPGSNAAPRRLDGEPPPPERFWYASAVEEVTTAAGVTFRSREGWTVYESRGIEYLLGPGEPVLASADGRRLLCAVYHEDDWRSSLVIYELGAELTRP